MTEHLNYPALYAAARRAAAAVAPSLALRRVPRGTIVYRNVSNERGERDARTVYASENNPNNRWTGRTEPAGGAADAPGVGGVYVCSDIDALTGELFHYSLGMTLEEDLRRAEARPVPPLPFRPPAADPTAGRAAAARLAGGAALAPPPRLTPEKVRDQIPLRRLFAFEVNTELEVGDLAPQRAGGRRLLDLVWHAAAVQAAAAGTPFRTMLAAYYDSADHSFPRGLCQGLVDARPRLAGVAVTSVRTEVVTTEGRSGFNLVVFGRDGDCLSVLDPVLQYDWEADPSGRGVRERVKTLR